MRQLPSHDAAGRVFRDGVYESVSARYLEIRQDGAQPRRNPRRVQKNVRFGHDRRPDLLAQRRMRDRECHRRLYARMLKQNGFDFEWGDLFPAAIDQFLDPSGQKEIAILVEISAVAGAIPAIAEGFRVCVRVVLITVEDAFPMQHHFAVGARREPGSPVVDDAGASIERQPDASGLALPRRPRIDCDHARLRRRIGLDDRKIEHPLEVAGDFSVERAGAGPRKTKLRSAHQIGRAHV